MRPTHIEVDLSKIGHNLLQVRTLTAPGVKVMGVVKANAYGHGIVDVARYLESKQIDILGVAFVQEAVTLRDAGITKPILVFYGAMEDDFPLFVKHNLELTVASYEDASSLNDFLKAHNSKVKVHLKTDTGMGRIGVQYNSAAVLAERIARLPNIELTGVYSHLATSEGDDPEYVGLQLERFHSVIENLKKKGIEIEDIHIANSGGIMHYPESHFTMVRPGIMLYGYPPGDKVPGSNTLRPPLSLRSKVGFVKDVGPDVSISYGRKFTTSQHTRIGTIPIGYADGYNRLLTNTSEVLIRGRRYPVVGTVCMDQIMVDLGNNSEVTAGDNVTLIGKDGNDAITAWELARHTGTIPYEILTSLSTRVPRIYTDEDSSTG